MKTTWDKIASVLIKRADKRLKKKKGESEKRSRKTQKKKRRTEVLETEIGKGVKVKRAFGESMKKEKRGKGCR